MEHKYKVLEKGTGFFKDFRDFAVRGNVIDLAVGVIIGGAFQPIVNSLVNDIIMPPIGRLMGRVDFKDLMVVIQPGTKAAPPYTSVQAAKEAGAVTINYGNFINILINFIIVAFAVFLFVKIIQAMKRKDAAEPPPPAPPTKSEELLVEIRDLLKAGRPPASGGPTVPAAR